MTGAMEKLETAFREYLQTEHSLEKLKTLSELLPAVNLVDEANALKTYLEQGSKGIYTMQQGVWAGRRCYVGPYPPAQAEFGDLWFDVVELTPMVLVPNLEKQSKDVISWLAVHPVYMWQFRAFLHLLKWEIATTYFLGVDDLLDMTRFNGADGITYASNIYYEEAIAYAIWFRKGTSAQFELQAAKHSLTESMFNALLPDNILLWKAGGFPVSEFIRMAVGQKTLDKGPEGEMQELALSDEERAALSVLDRTLFDEWERSENIGFSTRVELKYGPRISHLPLRGYEFTRLLNCAYRPGMKLDNPRGKTNPA